MKRFYLLSFVFLFSCNNNIDLSQENLLQESVFVKILEEVYLAESEYQLSKINDNDSAENRIAENYQYIFEKYNTTKSDFFITLNFYSRNPETLESYYELILKNLNEKRSKIN